MVPYARLRPDDDLVGSRARNLKLYLELHVPNLDGVYQRRLADLVPRDSRWARNSPAAEMSLRPSIAVRRASVLCGACIWLVLVPAVREIQAGLRTEKNGVPSH